MSDNFISVKIWKETHRHAKILAAHLGVSLVFLLHKLVVEEIQRHELDIVESVQTIEQVRDEVLNEVLNNDKRN